MKTIFALLCLLICAACVRAQECANVEWNGFCDPANNCFFNPSPAVGCSWSPQACFNCYRGFFDAAIATKKLNLDNEFVGHFATYTHKHRQHSRFIIDQVGPLAALGITKGICISRIDGQRLRRAWFNQSVSLKGKGLIVYKPGRGALAFSVILR